MEAVFVAAVFVAFLSGLEAKPQLGMSYTQYISRPFFQMRCHLSASIADTEGAWKQGVSRVDVQKRQYELQSWVSVNNGSTLNYPLPSNTTKLDEYNCTFSASLVKCEVKLTFSNLQRIDAGWYRCQYVPDPGNMNITWESGWGHISVDSKPDHVDLALIDKGNPDGQPSYAVITGGIKVYELDGTNSPNLTVKCSARGTFGIPKFVRVTSGGQVLHGSVRSHTEMYGKVGFMNEVVHQSVVVWNDHHPVSSLVGKDVECVAEGSDENHVISSSIIVRQRSPPVITCPEPKQSVKVRDTVDMKCVVYGVIPGDDIWWQVKRPSGLPDLKLREGETLPRFKIELTKVVDQTAYEVLLKIFSVTNDDFSTVSDEKYRVYASNKYGTQSATLSLSKSKDVSSASHLHISHLIWGVLLLSVTIQDILL